MTNTDRKILRWMQDGWVPTAGPGYSLTMVRLKKAEQPARECSRTTLTRLRGFGLVSMGKKGDGIEWWLTERGQALAA